MKAHEEWVKYRESKASENEPWPEIGSAECLKTYQEQVQSFVLSNHLDVKRERARLADIPKRWDLLLNRLREHKTRLAGAVTKKKKAKENEDERAELKNIQDKQKK